MDLVSGFGRISESISLNLCQFRVAACLSERTESLKSSFQKDCYKIGIRSYNSHLRNHSQYQTGTEKLPNTVEFDENVFQGALKVFKETKSNNHFAVQVRDLTTEKVKRYVEYMFNFITLLSEDKEYEPFIPNAQYFTFQDKVKSLGYIYMNWKENIYPHLIFKAQEA